MGNKSGKKADADDRIVGTASVFQPSDLAYSNVGYSGDFRCKYLCFDYDESLGLLVAGNSRGDVTFFGKFGIWKRLTVAMNQILVSVKFLQYERKVLTLTDDGKIFEVDVEKLTSRQLRFGKFLSHFSFFYPTFGDRNIFLGQKDGSLSLFDVREGKFNELAIPPLNKKATHILRLEQNWQHPYLYLLIYDAMEAFIYDIQKGEVSGKFSHLDNFRSGAWCADGKHVALGTDDGFILLCQTQTKLMRSDPHEFSLTDDAVRLPVYDIKACPSQKGSRFWCSGGNAKSMGIGLVSLIRTDDHKTFQVLTQVSPIFGGTPQSLCIVKSFVFFGANSLNLVYYNEQTQKTNCSLIDGSLLNKSQLFTIVNENHNSLIEDHIASTNQKAKSLLQFVAQGGFEDDSDPEAVKYAITGRGFKLQFWTVYNDLEQFELIYTLNIPAFAKGKLRVEELKTITAVETGPHTIAAGFESGHTVFIDYKLNSEEPCVHCFSVLTSPIKFIRYAVCLNRAMIIDQSNSLCVVDLETGEVKALEMLSESDAEIIDVRVAPLMATPVPGDVCFWIGYSDGTFKVFDCMRCQEWKLAKRPPLNGTLLKLFVVNAIGESLKCVEPQIEEAAPAMQVEEEVTQKNEEVVARKDEEETESEDFEEPVAEKVNQHTQQEKAAEQKVEEVVQTAEEPKKAEEKVVQKEEEVEGKAHGDTAPEVEQIPSAHESTDSFEQITMEDVAEAATAPENKNVMKQLQALGFVDSDQKQKKNSKEVTKEKKRSAELSNEMVKKISQPGEKRTPENKADAASPTTQQTEEIVSSEGWLIIVTTKAVYTIGLLPSKYAWKINENMQIQGIVDCSVIDSSYRTGLVLLTKSHFTVLRLMDMKVIASIPHRLPQPTTLCMFQSGWWICKTSNKRFYHGTFLLDEDTRDFSLPNRALQKKEFAPPMEKSRSEGFFKKKSLPSIEEIMTKHKTVRRKPREKKTPVTKEAKALSGVGVARNKMNENLRKAAERGEKVSELADKSAALHDQSDKFAALAKKLRQQQESSWF